MSHEGTHLTPTPIGSDRNQDGAESGTEYEEYDLSFAYSFNWDSPDWQIREALKVLLCNRETTEVRERDKAADKEAAKIRWLLAINPNTPPPVLEHLSRDDSAIALLERIAENPRTHSTTLARLSKHANCQVRAAVAENMNLSIKTIWSLARDENADVRIRLAESYHVPVAVLKLLCYDDNPYVQDRAQQTLQRMLKEVQSLRTA